MFQTLTKEAFEVTDLTAKRTQKPQRRGKADRLTPHIASMGGLAPLKSTKAAETTPKGLPQFRTFAPN